jgi:hypothetical protein
MLILSVISHKEIEPRSTAHDAARGVGVSGAIDKLERPDIYDQ